MATLQYLISEQPPFPQRKPYPASSRSVDQDRYHNSDRFNTPEDGTHKHQLKVTTHRRSWYDILYNLLHKQATDNQPSDLLARHVDQDDLQLKSKATPTPSTLSHKYGKLQEIIGRGASGTVWLSLKSNPKDHSRKQFYAIKKIRLRPQHSPKRAEIRARSEFCICSVLQHLNVIRMLEFIQDTKGEYCTVMEYCPGGDLYTLILKAGELDVIEADCFFKQLVRGVHYLHEMGVAHLDLKPENLLLTSDGCLKICDFGTAECFRLAWETEPHFSSSLRGSLPYIAPEGLVDEDFDPRAIDIWAVGIIYMAFRTGKLLWRVAMKDEDHCYNRYLQDRAAKDGYGPIESLRKAYCQNVIYSVLDPNPARRITAGHLLRSEWVCEIELCRPGGGANSL